MRLILDRSSDVASAGGHADENSTQTRQGTGWGAWRVDGEARCGFAGDLVRSRRNETRGPECGTPCEIHEQDGSRPQMADSITDWAGHPSR